VHERSEADLSAWVVARQDATMSTKLLWPPRHREASGLRRVQRSLALVETRSWRSVVDSEDTSHESGTAIPIGRARRRFNQPFTCGYGLQEQSTRKAGSAALLTLPK